MAFINFCLVVPLTAKSDFKQMFINFKSYAKNLLSCTIKTIRTNGGSEFVNHELKTFLSTFGISHEIACPHTPEQKGVAESKHRHLQDVTRTFLIQASLHISYWFETLSAANYSINRLPTKPISFLLSLFEKYFHKSRD